MSLDGLRWTHRHTPLQHESHSWFKSMASKKANSLGNMTKEDLVKRLHELGETPPRSWTKVELKCRVMEMEGEKGIKKEGKKEMTPLQQYVVRLNKANEKKSTLRTFLIEELGGQAPETSTKDQLNKIALDYIYDHVEPSETDPVGFGAHAAKSYAEVKTMEGDYCRWVLATAPDANSVRLTRLARWLQAAEMSSQWKRETSYPQAKAAPATLPPVSERGNPLPPEQASETQMVLTQLMAAVHSLKSEVENMKEERPRKKAADGGESLGSYSQITSNGTIKQEDIP